MHVFPSLASGSLLSVGQLCDVGCYAVFHKHFVKIFYNNHLILSGSRTDKTNGLWSIAPTPSPHPGSELCNNISTNDIPYVCNVLTPHNNMTEKIKFLQASMGYPTKSTIFIAVKKSNLASYPGGISKKTNQPALYLNQAFCKRVFNTRKTEYTIYYSIYSHYRYRSFSNRCFK